MPIDYSKYHPEWKDKIRPDILKRAAMRCEQCGIRHKWKGFRIKGVFHRVNDEKQEAAAVSAGYRVFRVILTIAHLDHNIGNNNYNNLKALCQQCHNRYDAKNRAITRKLKKANK